MNDNQTVLDTHALPFATWELRLYLNSHPTDRCALRLYHQLLARAACGNYASVYLDCPTQCEEDVTSALDQMDDAVCAPYGNLDEMMESARCCSCQTGDCCPLSWAWLEEPWPWECHDTRRAGA